MKYQNPTICSAAVGAAFLCAAGALSAAGAPSAAGAAWAGHHGPRFPVSIEDAEARAEERFVTVDADGNGEISLEEFEAAPRPRHHQGWRGHPGQASNPEQRAAKDEQLFSTLDKNDDGLLSPEEFSMRELRTAGRAMKREQMFTTLDADGNGVLTRDELPSMAARLRAMDTDGDGVVTKEEASMHHRAGGPVDS